MALTAEGADDFDQRRPATYPHPKDMTQYGHASPGVMHPPLRDRALSRPGETALPRENADGSGLRQRLLPVTVTGGAARPAPSDRPGMDGRAGLFWRLQLVGWGTAGMCVFFLLAETLGPRNAAFVALVRSFFGITVTCGLHLVYLRVPWRRMRPWALLPGVAVLCVGLGAAESGLCRHLLFLQLRETIAPDLLPMLERIGALARSGSYFGWSLLYFIIRIWNDSVEARLHAVRSEAAASAAELRQLQAQVNPHFLFNALNSIMAEKDDSHAVEKITGELAGYLRYALRVQDGFAPLGAELDQMERYLRIEKSRFEERFAWQIEADASARAVRVPAALVQPLLENACKYGRRTSPRLLDVRITAGLSEGNLRITVANTGHWLDFDPARSHGIGLANLRRRLELLSRGRARLLQSAEDGRVFVTVIWPPDGEILARKEAA